MDEIQLVGTSDRASLPCVGSGQRTALTAKTTSSALGAGDAHLHFNSCLFTPTYKLRSSHFLVSWEPAYPQLTSTRQFSPVFYPSIHQRVVLAEPPTTEILSTTQGNHRERTITPSLL
ncbi:hypothetical protein VTK56DRAFT_8346 [Thermocarpiscus australiensis]